MTDLSTKISELFGFGTIETFEPVAKGFLSENSIIHIQGAMYFLKKYRFTEEAKIDEIHSVKKFFSENGIPIVMPLKTKTGKTYFNIEDRFYALFPYVAESHLEYEKGQMNREAITSFGKMLARIHLVGKNATLHIDSLFKDNESLNADGENILKIIEAKEEKTEFDQLAAQTITLKKKLTSEIQFKYNDLNFKNDHLVHGDYTDQNVFFVNNVIAYVFDLEKAQYQPRFFELFRSMSLTFFNGNNFEQELRDAKTFLDAYLDQYPMSPEELRNGLKAYYLRSINSAWVEGEHYLKGNTRLDPLLFRDYTRVKYLSDHMEEIIEELK